MQVNTFPRTPPSLGVTLKDLDAALKCEDEEDASSHEPLVSGALTSTLSFIGVLLLTHTVLSDERTCVFQRTASIPGSNPQKKHYSELLTIVTGIFLAVFSGAYAYNSLTAVKKKRLAIIEFIKSHLENGASAQGLSSHALLQKSIVCLKPKAQVSIVQAMNFAQLIAVADSIGRARLQKILSPINTWDAFLMSKILKLPRQGDDTFRMLTNEDYIRYIELNVFFLKALRRHLAPHKDPKVRSLLGELQWNGIPTSPSNLRKVLFCFADGSTSLAPAKLLKDQCALFQSGTPVKFSINSFGKEAFDLFVNILQKLPQELKKEEIKLILPVATRLLALKFVIALDTYIASHLEEFEEEEIENLIKTYRLFLKDTKTHYEVYLMLQGATSITKLVKLHAKAKSLELKRVELHARALMIKRLNSLIRKPTQDCLSKAILAVKSVVDEVNYAAFLARLPYDLNKHNVVKLYEFNINEKYPPLNEAIFNFCKANQNLLSSYLASSLNTLPSELKEIIYPVSG